MNQLERIHGIIKRIQYKPNIAISAHLDYATDFIMCRVSGQVQNADNFNETANISTIQSQNIRTFEVMTDDQVVHFFYRMIRHFENHEIDEFFKIDGQHFRDPHPELKQDRQESFLSPMELNGYYGGLFLSPLMNLNNGVKSKDTNGSPTIWFTAWSFVRNRFESLVTAISASLLRP